MQGAQTQSDRGLSQSDVSSDGTKIIMSETGDIKTPDASTSTVMSQSVYGWALAACVAIGGLFVGSVMTGQFDSVFERFRGGLAGIGVESNSEIPSAETQQQALTEANDPPIPEAITPTFDIVRVEPTGEAVMAGLSFPNNLINIVSNGKVIAEAKSNASGEWALVLDQAFKPGGHAISVRTVSTVGELLVASEEQVTISVPNAPTESAIVMLDSPGSPSTIWQSPAKNLRPEVETEDAGIPILEDFKEPVTEPTESLELPDKVVGVADSGNLDTIPEALVTIETIETEGNGAVYATGASNPSTTIRVYFDEELVGQTTTNAIGRWQLSSRQLLSKDSYTVRVDQVDTASGQVLARRLVPFEDRIQFQIAKPVVTQSNTEVETVLNTQTADGEASVQVEGVIDRSEAVIVSKGDNLWSISRRLFGQGIRYTTLYDANENQIGDPSEVFPGQVFVVPGEETSAN